MDEQHHMTVQLTPVQWAETAQLDISQCDCVTAVVLKILDRKCKMAAPQQEAMLAIYDTLQPPPSVAFDHSVHQCIEQVRSRQHLDETLYRKVHLLRLKAEADIEKTVMKTFKSRLRRELFEQEP